jgi:hypothetical protein
MLCGPDGVLVPRPTGLDGLVVELVELDALELPEAPELIEPDISERLNLPSRFVSSLSKSFAKSVEPAASALLTDPSPSLSSASKLGFALCTAAPPLPAPVGALTPGCACGLAGSDIGAGDEVLGEVVLGETVLPDVCAYALPTARLIADRAINACFNFMSSSSEVLRPTSLRRMRARAGIPRKDQPIAPCLWRSLDRSERPELAF